MIMRFILMGLVVLIGLSSCVTKKKFEETLLNCAKKGEYYEDQMMLLGRQLDTKDQEIDTLQILYAEQRGANEVLLITQDKLQDRIDAVQDKVLEEKAAKTSTTQGLQSVMNEKDKQIRQRDTKLKAIEGIIKKQADAQTTMMGDFTEQLMSYGATNHSVKIISGELRIALSELLFFRANQARLTTDGVSNLARIATLINKYPSIKVDVVGNTDNQKVRGYTDNLELSALRAVNIVRALTEEYGVSSSRIMAGGKGEFAPVASNETTLGKSQNRRIDFIITSRMDRVVRDIDKQFEEE